MSNETRKNTVSQKLVVKLAKTYTAKGATEPTRKNRLVGNITMFADGSGILNLNHLNPKYTLLDPFVPEGQSPRPLPATVAMRKNVTLRKTWINKATGEEQHKYRRVGVFTMFTSGRGILDLNFTSDVYSVFTPWDNAVDRAQADADDLDVEEDSSVAAEADAEQATDIPY